MKFAITKDRPNRLRDRVADGIIESFLLHGHEISSENNGVSFILNLTDIESPRPGRRRSQSVFIISLVAADRYHGDIRSLCYGTLVRTLSNLLLCADSPDGYKANNAYSSEMYFTTPEAGFYHMPFEPERVYRRMLPIAGSHYAIENRFSTDLPDRLSTPSAVVRKIRQYGKELDNLGVLPTPFPLKQILSEEELRHIFKIYGITGLSYGNLSAREQVPEIGETTFWMTGRGVDKSNISKVGKDVFLVKGFDYETGEALVSVPRDHDPKGRVSVDAVEHELIYRTFPDVGAIVHVHAWMDGVHCTSQNYPCGTQELVQEVVTMLKQTSDPSHASVGLKNHGLTITGETLDEIFGRIRGRLLVEVPMYV
ncbi:MAG TPA: class II aldolase/adducin family protein [Bacteroidota bacterium]